MRKFSKKHYIAAGAAALIVAAGAGAAFAYWSTTGSGSGSATTGTSSQFVVTTSAPQGDPLTPGGPGDTVAFHIQNTNSGTQYLSSVTVTVANSDGSTWTHGDCSAADYHVGDPYYIGGQVASGATVDGTVTVSMINRSVSQDDCKGVTVPLYVVAG